MVEIDEKQGFSVIQKSQESGSVRIGINEVTKAVERGQAKIVFTANDVSPAEILAHIPVICKEMGIVCASIGNKAELGSSVGIKSTTAVAIVDGGSAKKEIEKLVADQKTEKKAAKKEEKPEAAAEAAEEQTEEKAEE